MADNNDPPFKRKLLAVLVSSLFVALVLPRAPPEASSREVAVSTWRDDHGQHAQHSDHTHEEEPASNDVTIALSGVQSNVEQTRLLPGISVPLVNVEPALHHA